jgi:3-deoxy-D-manno-octulosonic-acid transferase
VFLNNWKNQNYKIMSTSIQKDPRILKFSYWLYNIILISKFIEVIIKEFIKFFLLSNDYQKRRFFWERLGVLSNTIISSRNDKWIWVHANAIGEVNACQPLIRMIKDKYL